MTELTALLERETPIAEDPERMKKIREDVDRQIEYSKTVLDDAKARGKLEDLPKNVGKLKEALEKKSTELLTKNEAEKKHKENVPEFILREQESWELLGWGETEKIAVKDKLKKILGIDDNRAENALQMLVAAGKKPDEILSVLNDDSKFDYYQNDQEGVTEVVNTLQAYVNRGFLKERDHRSIQKYLYLVEQLGLTDEVNKKHSDYIKRFVLDDQFRTELDAEYDGQLPQDLFDLAWNIMYHEQDVYGLSGKFPILQMQVGPKKDDKGNILRDENGKEITEGRYVVNQGNFVRWLRDKMMVRYDVFETDEVPDFYSRITINKGQYATVNLTTMIFDKARYFKDETGYVWDGLYNQVFIEPWMLMFDRQYALEYSKAKGSDGDLVKAYTAMADLSKFTRKVIGQSMLDRSLMLPLDFKGNNSDTKMGEALLTMYLAYYNLADFDALEEVFGKESRFFKRETWIEAAQKVASTTMENTGMHWMSKIYGKREDAFFAAFDNEGNVKDKKKFIELINPYYQEDVPQTLAKALKEVLKDAVQEKFKSKEGNKKDEIDEFSLDYTWLKAYSWMFFTGGLAKNNFQASGGPAGWLAETKYLYTDAYRLKYETFGGAGVPYTDFMFKQMGVPLLEGMLLENASARKVIGHDKQGMPIFDKNPKTKDRYRTPMEVMLLMRKKSAEFENKIKDKQTELERATDTTTRQRIEREIALIEDEAKNYTKSFAQMLEFNDNAMSIWAKNLLARGQHLYDKVMKGKETAFDKFIHFDSALRGVSFDREAWQEALQSELITPLRYFFEANGATQLNMKTRAPVLVGWDDHGKPQWEFREQYLGERMMGHQILDIPQFRLTPHSLRFKEEAQEKGWRTKGKYVVDRNGRYVIDYDKVQEDKTMVWKQWMLMKIAGDLWAHIDRHSTDPVFSMDHYMKIIEAIENLHGGVMGDEYDMRGVRVTERLFSEAQMRWLKRISQTTPTQLFTRQFFSDIFIGDRRKKESMFGESASIILSAIFRGFN